MTQTSTTTYRVTCLDSETPITLPPTAHVTAILGQDHGRYTARVETSDAIACEAAMDVDATVISYEEED